MPSGVTYNTDMNPVMSLNSQKIFFTATTGATTGGDLYFCNADGSSVTKIYDKAGGNIILGAAY